MKTTIPILILIFPLVVFGSGKSVVVTVRNPADFERKDETIGVPLNQLARQLGTIEADKLIVADRKAGRTIVSQLTESELLFQSDFKPLEKKEFIVNVVERKLSNPQSLVDGRFEPPREDYAWENDRIAYRMYGPALAAEVNNGIDVWCKRVRYLIVDKWYSESKGAGKDTYHEDHGEGADFFSVGRTLGAGGSGLWADGKVLQPGVFSNQKTIRNGPIRVTFELTYTTWNVNGKKLTEHKRISLDAGRNLNRIEVTFMSDGTNDSLQIVCGLVKRNNTSFSTDEKNCWMSLWGLTTKDSANGFLGTGVVVPRESNVQFTEDKDQYLVIVKAKVGETFTYYGGAGWSLNGDCRSADDWSDYLTTFSQSLSMPLEVSVVGR